MKFQIENTSSAVILGVYEGASASEALDAMARDAGYRNYAHLQVEVPADEGEILVTQVEEIYADAAAQFGEVTRQGKTYALLAQAELTNRVFSGWWGDAREGEDYTSEWAANAIGQDGRAYVVTWQFDVVKGQEPEDDGDWPWDDEHVTDVQVV